MVKEYQIPEGMVKVPGGYQYRDKVDAIDLQRDDIVRGLCLEAVEMQKRLKEFKQRCHKAIGEHLVSANDGKINEKQVVGKMPPLLSLDGTQLIEIEQAPVLIATEQVVHLKKLLNDALEEMSETQREVAGEIVKKILRLDSGGAVNLKVANQLKGIKSISTPSWNEAMDLLPECTKQQDIHTRFRFYEVDEDGNKSPMLTNFSKITVGVPNE